MRRFRGSSIFVGVNWISDNVQTNQPKIFISHSWEDKPLVRRLEKELQAAGAEVWVDHEGIRGGDNLPTMKSDLRTTTRRTFLNLAAQVRLRALFY